MNGRYNSPFVDHRRGVRWNPARIEQEILRLRELPFFCIQSWSIADERLHVLGLLSYTQLETGRRESLFVRMEYPEDYPWDVPSVFDHDKRFVPSADGHQYPDYRLCLSFPFRREFPVGSESLAVEVLQASLVWLNKRCIFERLQQWPGKAEKHGYVEPFKLLLREEARRSQNLSVIVWCEWIIAGLVSMCPDKGCPCASGYLFNECHSRLLWLAMGYQLSVKDAREYERRATREAA